MVKRSQPSQRTHSSRQPRSRSTAKLRLLFPPRRIHKLLKREAPSVTVKARIFMAAALEAITRYILSACLFNPYSRDREFKRIDVELLVHTMKSSIALEKTLRILKVQQLVNPMLVQHVFSYGEEKVKSEPTAMGLKKRKIYKKYAHLMEVKGGRK